MIINTDVISAVVARSMSSRYPIMTLDGMFPIQLQLMYIWYTVLDMANGVLSAIMAKVVLVQNLSRKALTMATMMNQVTAPSAMVVQRNPAPAKAMVALPVQPAFQVENRYC